MVVRESNYPTNLYIHDATLHTISVRVRFTWAVGANNYTVNTIPEGAILVYDTTLNSFKPLIRLGNNNYENSNIDNNIMAISLNNLVRVGNETDDVVNVVLRGKVYWESMFVYNNSTNTWVKANTTDLLSQNFFTLLRYKSDIVFVELKS